MSKQQRIRVRLADGQVLSFKVVGFRLSGTLHVGGAETYRNTPDSRLPDEAPRPAPAGCPVCAHALSLMPDLSERSN